MLIAFFRSSFLIQYIALLLITAALWISAFMHPLPIPVPPSFENPIYSLAYGWLSGIHWIIIPLAVVFLLVEAFILNTVLIYHDIVPKNSLLPSIVFITLMSSNPVTLNIYPALLAILIFLFFLNIIFPMYDQEDNLVPVLSASLLLSASSLVYFPMVMLFPFLWMCFLIYRIFKWREWVISIVGFTLPYIYIVLYYFWTDRLPEAFRSYMAFFQGFFQFSFSIDIWQWIIWGILVVFILLPAAGRTMISINSYSINLRKKISVISWLTIFSAFTIFPGGDFSFHTVFIVAVTIFTAHYYAMTKKSAWNEIVFLTLVVLILIHNFLR
jgi:hypothetical protein